MSLKTAKMAKRFALMGFSKFTFLGAVGTALLGPSVFGQENLVRGSEPTKIPTRAISVPEQDSDDKNANRETAEISSLKPANDKEDGKDENKSSSKDSSKDAKDAKDAKDGTGQKPKTKVRDPIVLPALTVPNISIKGVGTGSVPEDFVTGRLPSTISLPYGPDRFGVWSLNNKTWTAPVYCHQPTYYEDTVLEQHGHERFGYLQPIASGVRFFSTSAFLPYLSYINPPLEFNYHADHYRPGSAAPCLRQRPPYDKGALRFQLLTTGTVILAGQP